MSNEQTSTESSNDDQTNEDSDVFQQEDNAIRGKFVSFSDTTLQDIPIEMLLCILVKAVAMEVKNMKLAKSVWKEKADLVISRLRTVCSQWSNVFATDFFRLELHRVLDGIAPGKIRMEILHESFVNYFALKVDTLNDDILMYCRDQHPDSLTPSGIIAVYDRNNAEKVKEVIALPFTCKGDMAACNVSNCVYVLQINEKLHCVSILRFVRDEEHKFNIQTWISDLKFPISYSTFHSSGSLSVSDKGELIVISRPGGSFHTDLPAIRVYNPNGVLQHEVMLSPHVYGFKSIDNCVINKSNGNLVFAFVNRACYIVLIEIDAGGRPIIQRKFMSSFSGWSRMNFADSSGRFLIHDCCFKIELLDVELNRLEFTGPRSDPFGDFSMHSLHFNSERNELLGLREAYDVSEDVRRIRLRIFRFIEE